MSDWQEIRQKLRGWLRYGLTLVAILGLVAEGASAQGQGPKQTQRLAKKAGSTVKALTEARVQILETLGDYNTILGDVEDRRKAYKGLLKAMDKSDKKVATLRKKVIEMNGEANLYFADWGKSVDGIAGEEVRERGQARLDASRQRYSEILGLGKLAGDDYEVFIKALRDQVLYLGHDLNPAGVASVEGDAKKLREQASVLFGKIDMTTKAFNGYIRALDPE